MLDQTRKDNCIFIMNEHWALADMGLLETVYIKNQDIHEVLSYFIEKMHNSNKIRC